MVRGSELDPALRAAIVSLRFGAELEPREIGAKLNIETGTIRTTCFRIKKAAGGSTDLRELLQHCQTKSRSGRPSLKKVAAASAATPATIAAAATAAAATTGEDQDKREEGDGEAQVGEVSPLAENAGPEAPALALDETPAWPERDLTTAAIHHNNNQHIHDQQHQADYTTQPPLDPTVDPALHSAV